MHCEKCYDTPCVCGERYKHLPVETLGELIQTLTTIYFNKLGFDKINVDDMLKMDGRKADAEAKKLL